MRSDDDRNYVCTLYMLLQQFYAETLLSVNNLMVSTDYEIQSAVVLQHSPNNSWSTRNESANIRPVSVLSV